MVIVHQNVNCCEFVYVSVPLCSVYPHGDSKLLVAIRLFVGTVELIKFEAHSRASTSTQTWTRNQKLIHQRSLQRSWLLKLQHWFVRSNDPTETKKYELLLGKVLIMLYFHVQEKIVSTMKGTMSFLRQKCDERDYSSDRSCYESACIRSRG